MGHTVVWVTSDENLDEQALTLAGTCVVRRRLKGFSKLDIFLRPTEANVFRSRDWFGGQVVVGPWPSLVVRMERGDLADGGSRATCRGGLSAWTVSRWSWVVYKRGA